jgi:transcriptional regulator GlxA family with amidase domain
MSKRTKSLYPNEREIFSQAAPGCSMTSVASRCGFHNQGHFAKSYLARFGELLS